MPLNRDLVNEISSDVRILKDTVEYHWLVGCTPTAVANVLGYWDRNGFDNLIEGDSSYFSTAVKNAIASPEHYQDYYRKYLDLAPDASSSTKLDAHESNSIADFLLTSREEEGQQDGWTASNMIGVGLHGYATYRGYTNFETTQSTWGSYTFNNIADEIDAGRPVILDIDTDASGSTDHNVVVYGYDNATQELIIHDGWVSTDELRRISFSPIREGTEWGIGQATFVSPPDSNLTNTVDPQFLHITDDGSDTASAYEGSLNGFGGLATQLKSTDSNLGRNTLALASADGHRFYQLLDDGSGTAHLYRTLYDGSGTFRWKSLNNDSGLGRNTIGFATADGNAFYQLLDDGAGTAALYKSLLRNDGTFARTLLNANSGLSRSRTLGLSTTDGKTFYQLLDDGAGTAALYKSLLRNDGTFDWALLNADSGASRDTRGQSAWVSNPTPPPITEGATIAGNDGIDTLAGTVYADALSGNGGDDKLLGYEGNDTLTGGAGNDEIRGHEGNDILNGTDADSRGEYEIDYINVGAGQDTVILGDETGIYYTADGWTDRANIDGFEIGTDQLVLYGNADLYSLSENDRGTYLLHDNTAVAFLIGVENFTLSNNNVTFVGEVAVEEVPSEPIIPPDVEENPTGETLTGTSGDDVLKGTAFNDELSGAAGKDQLFGYEGDDTLIGGSGNDGLVAGSGDDTLNGTDAVSRGAFEKDYLNLGTGQDTVILGDESGSYYAAAGWQDRAFIVGFETSSDNLVLFGNADQYKTSNNGEGTHILWRGESQNDQIAFLSGVFEISLESDNVTFVGDVEPETVTETVTSPSTSPGTSPESIDYNPIVGTSGNDGLIGTDGADRINGLGGADYMRGGAGADQFVLGNREGSFYTQGRWSDYANIADFTAGTDQLVLYGSADDYTTTVKESGVWLFAGSPGGEAIAHLSNLSNLDLNSQQYI